MAKSVAEKLLLFRDTSRSRTFYLAEGGQEGEPSKSWNSNLKIDSTNKHMSGETIKYFLALVYMWFVVNFFQMQI